MSAFRLGCLLILGLTGTFFTPTTFAQGSSEINPKPNPVLGLDFALYPASTNDSITEPDHNGTTLAGRQATGLAVWVSHWYPPPQCSDGVCTVTSGDDLPHIQINGDGFTVGGRVFAGIYTWPANSLYWGMNINVQFWPGFRDGSFGLQTPVIDCLPSDPSHVGNSYAAAYDWTTASWSPIWWLYTGCAVL